jgi:hypothetical protein
MLTSALFCEADVIALKPNECFEVDTTFKKLVYTQSTPKLELKMSLNQQGVNRRKIIQLTES